jgi:hypothetical protein
MALNLILEKIIFLCVCTPQISCNTVIFVTERVIIITLTQILKILLIGVTGTLVINVTKCQNFRFIVHLVFSVPKLFCEI